MNQPITLVTQVSERAGAQIPVNAANETLPEMEMMMSEISAATETPTVSLKDEPTATQGTAGVTSKKDVAEFFYEYATLCMSLFSVLGEVGKFINQTINANLAAMRARTAAKGLSVDSGPPSSVTGAGTFPFGGNGPDKVAALKRANDLTDLLHSFGLAPDFPPGYAKDKSVKVTESDRTTGVSVDTYNSWLSGLDNQIEQVKNNSQIETTKAEGILKSSGAIVEPSADTLSGAVGPATLKPALDSIISFLKISSPYSEVELDALYNVGVQVYQQRKWEDASTLFGMLNLLDPFNPVYLTAQGKCFKCLSAYDDAYDVFHLAWTIDSGLAETALHAAECLILAGRRDEAISLLNKILATSAMTSQNFKLRDKAEAWITLLTNGEGNA